MPVVRRCSVDECDRPHKGHGLCNMHLIRLKTHGSLLAQKEKVRQLPKPSVASKVRLHTHKREDGHWEWTAGTSGQGAAYVWDARKQYEVPVKRWIYEKHHRIKLNTGTRVWTTCGFPHCLNPEHQSHRGRNPR